MLTKVVEIGAGGTGTRSVAQAMAWLGYSSRHGLRKLSLQDKKNYAACILRGSCKLGLYNKHEFVGNISLLHWRILLEEEPEMKFILSNRDIDDWIASAKRPSNSLPRHRRVRKWLSDGTIPFDLVSTFGPLMLFGTYVFHEKMWRDGFARYYKQVRETIPPDRLFEVNVFEGDSIMDLGKWLDSPNCPPSDIKYPKKKISGAMSNKNRPW